MERLVVAAGGPTGRRTSCLQVDLPVGSVQLASEEVELLKTWGKPISIHFRVIVHDPPPPGREAGALREVTILTSSPAAALRRDDRVTLQGPRIRRRRRAERQRLIRCAVATHIEVETCVG